MMTKTRYSKKGVIDHCQDDAQNMPDNSDFYAFMAQHSGLSMLLCKRIAQAHLQRILANLDSGPHKKLIKNLVQSLARQVPNSQEFSNGEVSKQQDASKLSFERFCVLFALWRERS